MKRKKRYPGEKFDETRIPTSVYIPARKRNAEDDKPDMIGMAPNYEKFWKAGYSTEQVLVMLNID